MCSSRLCGCLLATLCALCVPLTEARAFPEAKPEAEAAPDRFECPCTREYDPVCGEDGRTYNNPCLAKCEKVSMVCHDECGLCNSNKKHYPDELGLNDIFRGFHR